MGKKTNSVKNFFIKEILGPNGFIAGFHATFREEIKLFLLKFCQKIVG